MQVGRCESSKASAQTVYSPLRLSAHGEATLGVANMNALEGLVPITALGNTDAGRASLASNFTITGDIQSGVAHQPLLLAFADQQQQALRDALITGVAYELADGLGNKLGVAYQTTIIADCKTSIFTSKLPARRSPDRICQRDITCRFRCEQVLLRQRNA